MPLSGLVNYPLHLVGLGGRRTCPLGFVIARLQVREVAGYDEDVVFLVVPDGSNFGKRVPIVIGTCTLARVINVIKESEMDRISTPWSTVRLAQLLSRRVVTEGTPSEEEERAHPKRREWIQLSRWGVAHMWDHFRPEILEGKISQAPVCDTHVMVTPVGSSGIEAGQGMSATSRVTSAAYLHDHDGWPQTNIDSGAEHD